MRKALYDRIMKARAENPNVTQTEIARIVGCTPPSVSNAIRYGCEADRITYQRCSVERDGKHGGNDFMFTRRWTGRDAPPIRLPKKLPGSSIEPPTKEQLMGGR